MQKYTFREKLQGLPWAQLACVAIMRVAEPISFTSLFPYVYYMIKNFDICPENEIGRYAGYLSGAFALCQCLTGIFWGRMSDKYGRKVIVIMGLMGSAFSMLTFGFASSYSMAVLARCVAGLLNGNVGVIRTIIGEIAKERRHQSIAFSIMPLVWQLGSVVGPMVGGYLAQPVSNHPGWFNEKNGLLRPLQGLFTKYPFLFPNVIVVSVLVFAAITTFFFFDETHDVKKRDFDLGRAITRKVWGCVKPRAKNVDELASLGDVDEEAEASPLLRESRSASGQTPEEAPVDEVDQSWSAVLCAPVVHAIISVALLAAGYTVFDELLPVYLSSKPEPEHTVFPFKLAGGLGMTSAQIGNCLSFTGIAGMFVILVLFPWIDHRFGSLKVFRFSSKFIPLVYFMVPYFVLLVGAPQYIVSSVIVFHLFIRTLIHFTAQPALLLLANRAAAHTRHLGVVNGCIQVASAFSRATGPIIWGYLMTAGQKIGYGQLPWWTLAAVGGIGVIQTFYIGDRDDNGEMVYE